MKIFTKWFEIVVLVIIVGLSITSCKKDVLDGTTWKGDRGSGEIIYKFNHPNYTMTRPDSTVVTGSYSVDGTKVIMTWSDNFDVKINGTIADNKLSVIVGGGDPIIFKKK